MSKRPPKKRRVRTGLSAQFPSEYNSWKAMRSRCWYPSNPSYQYFGAVGIEVCPRWADSFAPFMEDMGPKPSSRHGLSLKDRNRGYEPENCYWATPTEQQIHSCKAIFLEYQGERLCLSEWARKLGISMRTISTRINKFLWTPEQALGIQPVMGKKPIGDARRASTPKRPILGTSKRNLSSRVYGVSYHKQRKVWQAVVRGMGKPIYCGYYPSKEEAIAAVKKKAKEIAEEMSRNGESLPGKTRQ